jgi:AcrR family transcriptional regulator
VIEKSPLDGNQSTDYLVDMPPESTRERLLMAARDLFSQHGYSGASTRAIAAQAGCNLSMIKHYFGSKEGLLHAAVGVDIERVAGRLQALLGEPVDPVERLRRFIDFMVDHLAANRQLIVILHRELVATDSPLLAALRPQVAGVQQLFVALVEGVRQAGQLRDIDPKVAGVLLMGMLYQYFIAYPIASMLIGELDDDRIAAIKRHAAEIFLRGVLC